MSMDSKINVLLPRWIFDQAENENQLKMLVLDYMRRYPDYAVKSVKNGFAICERK